MQNGADISNGWLSEKFKNKIFNMVDSSCMKDYLMERQEELRISDYQDLILNVPVDIRKKIELLKELQNYTPDEEERNCLKSIIKTGEDARDALFNADPDKTRMTITMVDTEKADVNRAQIMECVPVISYNDAIRYIKEDFGNVENEEDIEAEDQLLYYFKIGLYDVQWTFELEGCSTSLKYEYICLPSGKIVYFEKKYPSETKWNEKDINATAFAGHGLVHDTTPYRAGDILRIDCRPFLPPAYCLVYYASPAAPFDCCGLRCMYPTYGGIISNGALKHGHFYANESFFFKDCPISPLLRAEKYTGTLPKECAFMEDISRRLKDDPMLSEKMDIVLERYISEIFFREEYKAELVGDLYREDDGKVVTGFFRDDFERIMNEAEAARFQPSEHLEELYEMQKKNG